MWEGYDVIRRVGGLEEKWNLREKLDRVIRRVGGLEVSKRISNIYA